MKVLLVGESLSSNLGDQAIFITLKHLLECNGFSVTGWDLSRYRFVELADEAGMSATAEPAADTDVRAAQFSRIRAGLIELVNHLPGFAQKWAVFATKKRAAVINANEWTRILRDFDMVLFGGGALLQDVNWSFPLGLVEFSRAARRAGIPSACAGVSVGSRFSKPGRRWLQEFLDYCSYIALRDERSREDLSAIGRYNTEVYPDSALLTSSVLGIDVTARTGTLGINVIGPLRHPRLRQAAHRSYLARLAEFIRAVDKRQAGEWRQILLFTTGQGGDYDAARSLLSSSELRSLEIELRLAPSPGTLGQLCQTIASLDVVVSTRMHAGVLAKSFRRPLVAIGWDGKVRGFCEMIGIEDYYTDIEDLRPDFLARKVREIAEAGYVQPDRYEVCIDRINELPARLKAIAAQ